MNIKSAIENYLSVIFSEEGDESDRILKLIRALDELAFVANRLDYKFDPHDYPDPPERNYSVLREAVMRSFPSFGAYEVPIDIYDATGKGSMLVGNSIDDCVDIAADLRDALWRYENTSKEDASFHFELLFRVHWGTHLRSLQLYLHDRHW